MNTTISASLTRIVAAFLTPLLFLGFSQKLLAQGTTDVPEAIKRLWILEGEWKGEATVTIGDQKITFTLHHSNTKISDGMGIEVVESGTIPGLGEYRGVNLFGYDAGSDMLHLFSVTTDPATHDHKGMWSDANHFSLRYEGLQEGKRFVEDISAEIKGKNQYSFKSVVMVGGEPGPAIEVTMKRVK